MHFPLHLTHLTESTPGDGSQHGHLFSAHSASPSAGDDVVERERERKGGGGGGGGECSSTSKVEVLKGAAVVVVEGGERERERMVREAKERMRKKGKEAEGKW